jgi:hypothetical protein
MALTITGIGMSTSGTAHEHITSYRWKNDGTGKEGISSKPTMVEWLDSNKGKAFCGTGSQRVAVAVERPVGTEPYLRTYADRIWTNNLLALPRV